jgi:lysophospholipase L1-like esterase
MKRVFLTASFLLLIARSAQADFLIQPDDVVGIAGDSITAQHLYSAFMEDYLLMCQLPQSKSIVQFGWSGEQAPGFLARLDDDVFPFKPTVMTTCYGMNDGHYGPISDSIADTFRKAQTGIVDALKKNGVRAIVLGSSKCVDSQTYHGDPAAAVIYNKTLGSLADIDKQIAQQEGVVYADVYGITLDAMEKAKAKFGQSYVFAGADGVHPGPNGHLVMAYAFLKALGCDGNIGTITVDDTLKQATGTPGQEIVSYHFCFSGTVDSKDPGTTAAISTCIPFNDDLNRYMLVVKGLTTAKAKITWGATTKEYTAAELSKGINLASEFLANPFVDQFMKVDSAVKAQEAQETVLSQMFMHSVKTWKATFAPGTDAAFDQIISAGMTQHDALYKAAAALVIPIEHTIKIEPST